MNSVSATLNLKEALAQIKGMVEVCDENGSIIGFVVSPDYGVQLKEERKAFYDYLASLTTPEELERARKSTRRYTTADVWKLFEEK